MFNLVCGALSGLLIAVTPVAPNDPSPDVAREIEREFDNFARVGAIAPFLTTVFRDGDLNAWGAAGTGVEAPFARLVVNIEESEQDDFPVEMVVGVDAGGMSALGMAVRVAVLQQLLVGVLGPNGGFDPSADLGEVPAAFEEILEILEAAESLRLVAAFRFGAGAVPRDIFDGIREDIEGNLGAAAVTELPAGFEVDMFTSLRTPKATFMRSAFLTAAGIENEALARFEQFLEGYDARARFTIQGDWARLEAISTVKAKSNEPKPPISTLRTRHPYPNDDPPGLFVRWDLRPALRQFSEAERLVDRWSERSLGKRMIERDPSWIGAIEQLRGSTEILGLRGRVTATQDTRFQLSWLADLPEGVRDLRSDPLSKWVPADVEGFFVGGTRSFAQIARDFLILLEERSPSDGERSGAALLAQEALVAADRHLGEIAKSAPRGCAAILDGSASVGVVIHGAGAEPLELDDVPLPRFAIVMPAVDTALDRGLWTSALRQLFGLTAVEADLGLSAPTVRLNPGELSRVFNFGVRLREPDGPWALHLAELDGHLVLSTSVELTRKLRASAAGEISSIELQGDRPIVSACGPSASPWERCLRAIGERFASIGSNPNEEGDPASVKEKLRTWGRTWRATADLLTRAKNFRAIDTVLGDQHEVAISWEPAPSRAPRIHATSITFQHPLRGPSIEWLLRQRNAQGYWPASCTPLDNPIASTALAVRAFPGGWSFSRALFRARDRAERWLIEQQVVEGEHAGRVGDATSPHADFAHWLAIAYLAANRLGAERAAAAENAWGYAYRQKLLPESPSAEMIVWMKDAADGARSLAFLDDDFGGGAGRFDALKPYFQDWLRSRSESDRAPALAVRRSWDLGEDVLRAECRRLLPELFGEAENSPSLLEVWIVAGLVVGLHDEATAERRRELARWLFGWRDRLLETREAEGEHAGSWSFGSNRFETTVYALLILDSCQSWEALDRYAESLNRDK